MIMNYRNLIRSTLSDVRRHYEASIASPTTRMVASTANDVTLNLDYMLEKRVIDNLITRGVPARIESEELAKPLDIAKDPTLLITIDPLDGTANAQRQRAPYATIITIFDSLDPTFGNAVAAGILELTSGDTWIADEKACYFNSRIAKPSDVSTLSKRDPVTQCMVDVYYPDNVQTFKELFGKAWVRDYGSAGTHLAWVSSGQADAAMSVSQKNHELGAGYRLITSAGGVVTDLDGNDLRDRPYKFNDKIPMVAAANKELHKEILKVI